MSVGGWIIMSLSCGLMTGLLCWCIWRVITTPEATKHVHSQADIDPHDADDE